MSDVLIPDLYRIIPECILVISAILILMEGAFRKITDPLLSRRFGRIGILAIVIALASLLFQHNPGETWITFEGQIVQDDFIFFAKLLILVGSAAILTISLPSLAREHILSFEYTALILFATVGMLLMVEANDFMSLFVGLEMQALSLYVLAALNRDKLSSSEAALKYFVLGAISTCLYLYGASLLYGYSGSTSFNTIAGVIRVESGEGLPLGFLIALVFIIE